MAKERQVFFCKECGYESAKWTGQCPACHEWNTFSEAPKTVKAGRNSGRNPAGGRYGEQPAGAKPSKITEVTIDSEDRYITGIGELDRVLAGRITRVVNFHLIEESEMRKLIKLKAEEISKEAGVITEFSRNAYDELFEQAYTNLGVRRPMNIIRGCIQDALASS